MELKDELLSRLAELVVEADPQDRTQYIKTVQFYNSVDMLDDLDLAFANSIPDDVVACADDIRKRCYESKAYITRGELEEIIGKVNVKRLIMIGTITIGLSDTVHFNINKDELNISKINWYRQKNKKLQIM